MNWKLIFGLSMFGLVMAFATISLIPANIEQFVWPVIMLVCAYLVAVNAPGKYFLHGFLICLLNCLWITSAHIAFATTYLANHTMEANHYAEFNKNGGLTARQAMLVMGPMIGIVSGLVLGLFSFAASKVFRKHG